MSDVSIHVDNDTPKASDEGIKRLDKDTNAGLGDSIGQGLGYTPTNVRIEGAIQNSPKTWS